MPALKLLCVLYDSQCQVCGLLACSGVQCGCRGRHLVMLPLVSVRSTGCWPLLKWHSTAFLHQVLHTRHPVRRCGPPWWHSRGMGDTAVRALPRTHWTCPPCAGARTGGRRSTSSACASMGAHAPRRSRCLWHHSGRHSSETACLPVSGCSRASQAVLAGVTKR